MASPPHHNRTSEPGQGGHGFRRVLGPFDATMVVIGGIIGAGIFINPYIVAQRMDSPAWVLGAWAAGGALALAGALSFAELGSLFPRAGGQYVYLRDAFHPLAGFLYGWALLLMIECGAIAAVAITFAEYTLRLVGRPEVAAVPLAALAIVVVAAINYFGVKPGSRVLNVFVVLKVVAILVLVAAAFLLPGDGGVGAAMAEGAGGAGEAAGGGGLLATLPVLAFGAALVPVMFSYGGWQNANYVAEEIHEPERNVPLSLILGTAVVVTVYLLVNWAYLKALGQPGLAATLTPAADTARSLMGPLGDRFVAATIAVSTFGFLNLTMLAPTRVYWAMADDGIFFRSVARLHPRWRSPSVAILLQTGWALVLVLTGTYAQLVDYVVFADWIFFGGAVATVFVFRRTVPLATRPEGTFRVPGYPWIPGAFVLVAAYIVLSVMWTNPVRSGLGAALLLTGVPAYLWWSRRADAVGGSR